MNKKFSTHARMLLSTSPTGNWSPASAKFGSRIPKPIQRALPFYFALLVFLILAKIGLFGSILKVSDVMKRDLTYATPRGRGSVS